MRDQQCGHGEDTLVALMVDGANHVRGHGAAAPSTRSLAVFAGVAAMAALLALVAQRSARGARWARGLVAAALVAAALPGVLALASRADAPACIDEAAEAVARLEAEVRAHTEREGCIARVDSRCEACEPLVLFARTRPGTCASDGALVLGPDALERPCHVDGHTLRCGSAP